MAISAKRKIAQKEAAKKRPQTWKKGQSGNPNGAPRRGESWAEIITRIGEMTPAEAAKHCKALASQIAKIGDGVTLKEAVVMRVYAALLFEPSTGLLNAFMDRVEGKPNQPVTMAWRDDIVALIKDGKLTWSDVNAELGASLAAELFRAANVLVETDTETYSES